MPPDRVTYRLEPTGRTPHERAERLVTRACPSCGADWRPRGAATPRHEGRRTYRCSSCGEHHRAVEVDAAGRPVASPGSWGLTQQHRLRRRGQGGTPPDRG